MANVELIPAFFWSCPDCDNENFVKAARPNLSHDEEENIYRAIYDVEVWKEIPDDVGEDLYMTPEDVTCLSCGRTFDTFENENDGYDVFDDDDDSGSIFY